MGTRLFVGNLSYRVTEPELKQVFEEGGRNVVEVKIVTDRDTGRSRGFAFVEMGSDAEASRRHREPERPEIAGRPINVSEARARTPRAPRRLVRWWRRWWWWRRWLGRRRRSPPRGAAAATAAAGKQQLF